LREHRILLVEDDASIREAMADALRSEGYDVTEATDGARALALGLSTDPDLIVLDLMLPSMDGLEVLRRLREDAVETPILVVTARGLEQDKLKGFALGADDYIVKPFSLAEFLARVASRLKAWDRERGSGGRRTLRFGGAIVDFTARTARRGDQPVSLTPQEYDLLSFLASHEGKALSRAAILDGVWGVGSETTHRVVDNAMLNLRKKLEAEPARPVHLRSVRGIGYRFTRKP